MSGIGEQLRKAREAKGLSISDIEKATKIQSRYLEAIENNEFDKLPGDFYVRAFIRQYAQIVGLDGKELLSQYQGEVANEVTNEVSQPAESPAQEVHEEAEVPAPAEPAEKETVRPVSRPAKREIAEEPAKDAKWRKLVPRLALGCGIALLLLIGGMVVANMRKTGSSSQKENAGSSVTITSKKSSSKKSSSASSSSKKKTSSIKVASLGGSSYRVTGIKSSTPLVVRSSKQSIYYYVSVDNVITNQGTLQSGEKHTETVKKGQTLIVYLGTDTGVTVTVGGKKIPFTPINGTTRLTIYLGDSSASSSTSSAASSSTNTNTNTSTSTSYSSRTSSSVQSSASSRPAASSSSVQSSSQASSSAAPSSQSSAAPSSSAASSSKQ
ncbi:helix-turn-helix domain-containing protein [Lactobacillus sp.]|uniref:helix-turn-helix domain-containing protein n=1 Tax=Lactobacillus sp. TaxID=1591 RepID=UPI003F0D2E53